MPEGATEVAMAGAGAWKAGCRLEGAKLELNVVAMLKFEVRVGDDEEDEPMLSKFHRSGSCDSK